MTNVTVTQAILDMYQIGSDAAQHRARGIYSSLEAQGYVRRLDEGVDFEPTPKADGLAVVEPGTKQRKRLRTGRCLVWNENWVRQFISDNIDNPPPRRDTYIDPQRALVRFYYWPGFYPDLMLKGEPCR
jgi:hypothetical protein